MVTDSISMRVRLVRSVVNSYATTKDSTTHSRKLTSRNGQTPRGLPAFLDNLTASCWVPSLRSMVCPTIFESSEEDGKDDISIPACSSTVVEFESFSLLLPESTVREDQEIVLIEKPQPPTKVPPSIHRRCKSAEPRLETSSSSAPKDQEPPSPTSSSRNATAPPAGILEVSRQDGREEQKSPHSNKRRGHRRLASAPALPAQTHSGDVYADVLQELTAHLQYLQERHGGRHPLVAACLNQIGNVCFRHQQHDKALEAYKRAVCCCDLKHSGEHLADAYANIGTVYWSSGQLELGTDFLEKALAVHEYMQAKAKSLGESLAAASVRHQLGTVYTLRGSFDQALEHFLCARKIQQHVLGLDHLDVARTMDAMGKTYLLCGDYQSALHSYEEAFRIKQRSANPDVRSKALCESLLNIAAVYRARNDFEAAISTYCAIVELQKQELRLRKSQAALLDAAGSWNTLGELYVASGQNSQAQDAYYEADHLYDAAGVSVEDRPPRARILSEHEESASFLKCFDITCMDAGDLFYIHQ